MVKLRDLKDERLEFAKQKKTDIENLYYEEPNMSVNNSKCYDKLKADNDLAVDSILKELVKVAKQGEVKDENTLRKYFENLMNEIPYNLWWYYRKLKELKLIAD